MEHVYLFSFPYIRMNPEPKNASNCFPFAVRICENITVYYILRMGYTKVRWKIFTAYYLTVYSYKYSMQHIYIYIQYIPTHGALCPADILIFRSPGYGTEFNIFFLLQPTTSETKTCRAAFVCVNSRQRWVSIAHLNIYDILQHGWNIWRFA
jgi:hypothetical protein